MKGQAFIYRPLVADPEVVMLDSTPGLEFLKHAIGGGWLEAVPGWLQFERAGAWMPCAAFCDEEGKLKEMPINTAATIAWDRALRRLRDAHGNRIHPTGLMRGAASLVDVLRGPVIVVTGDDELMAAL